MAIVLISGSPSARSRSAALLAVAARQLENAGFETEIIAVRDLPALDLVHGRHDSVALKAAGRQIESASGLVIASPIYKASHSGVLKAFLDLLQPGAFTDKVVFPIGVGGSPAHMLAIDCSLRPVLAALGATHVLGTLYATDAQVRLDDEGKPVLHPDIALRLEDAVDRLAHAALKINGARKPFKKRAGDGPAAQAATA